MKLTLQNIKKLKQETNSFLTKKVCNYVINNGLTTLTKLIYLQMYYITVAKVE